MRLLLASLRAGSSRQIGGDTITKYETLAHNLSEHPSQDAVNDRPLFLIDVLMPQTWTVGGVLSALTGDSGDGSASR